MQISGLENKEFVFTIQYVLDVDGVLTEGIENELDTLRERGSAEVIEVELRTKEE